MFKIILWNFKEKVSKILWNLKLNFLVISLSFTNEDEMVVNVCAGHVDSSSLLFYKKEYVADLSSVNIEKSFK